MTERNKIVMDGFSKVRLISEGYINKGGVNATTRINSRPPPPAPMKPAASSASSSAGKVQPSTKN